MKITWAEIKSRMCTSGDDFTNFDKRHSDDEIIEFPVDADMVESFIMDKSGLLAVSYVMKATDIAVIKPPEIDSWIEVKDENTSR